MHFGTEKSRNVMRRACRAGRRDTHLTTSATSATRSTQQRTQQERKCGAHSFAANSSANVLLLTIRLLFWFLHYVKIITVITEKRYRRNLNQIGNLQRKTTIIGNGI